MKIFVANLGFNTRAEDLTALFSKFGKVDSAKVIMDRETNRSKCYGFVEMPNEEEALAAITADDDEWAFISSGTWSLMGMVTPTPLQTPEVLASDFTNEGAVSGDIRILKNITGLWLLQSLVKEWTTQGLDCDYSRMVVEGEASKCESVIPVTDSRFTAPRSMKDAIDNYCKETNQEVPQTQGDYMRLVCQSLATEYAKVKQN